MTTRFTELIRIWKNPILDQTLAKTGPDRLVAVLDRLAAAILCATFWGLTGAVLGGLTTLFTQTPAAQVASIAALIGASFGVGIGLSSSVSKALKATGILKITLIGTLTVGLGLLLGYAMTMGYN